MRVDGITRLHRRDAGQGTANITETVVGGLTVKNASHNLHLNAKHRHRALISAIVIQSDTSLAPAIQKAEGIMIGGLD